MLPRKTAYPAFSEHFLADKRNLFVSIVDTFNVVPKFAAGVICFSTRRKSPVAGPSGEPCVVQVNAKQCY